MLEKEFKTIDEQISLLQSRGLEIPDIEIARVFLYRNNYYRISGYSLTLRNHDIFSKNTTFQNIIDIYKFDHELRHTLLKYLVIIEVTVKSIYAYEFTKVYGPTGYLNQEIFTDKNIYRKIMEKADKQKKNNLPHEAYLRHFIYELKQDIPLWAFVDLLTISNISFLLKISPTSIKQSVAASFNLHHQGDKILIRFMHNITILRNLCAHGSRIYNRIFEQMPWLKKSEQKLLRKNLDGSVDNMHLYGFIIIMRRLLKTSDFSALKSEIANISLKYPFVDLKYYGFREDWQEVL